MFFLACDMFLTLQSNLGLALCYKEIYFWLRHYQYLEYDFFQNDKYFDTSLEYRFIAKVNDIRLTQIDKKNFRLVRSFFLANF